jgi:hypothetical protein
METQRVFKDVEIGIGDMPSLKAYLQPVKASNGWH